MISKALELNKENPTLHFNIWIKFLFQLQHLFSISWLKKCFFLVWWYHGNATACSGLESAYFIILKQYPLRNNNRQSNLPRKKAAEKFEIETCLYHNDTVSAAKRTIVINRYRSSHFFVQNRSYAKQLRSINLCDFISSTLFIILLTTKVSTETM